MISPGFRASRLVPFLASLGVKGTRTEAEINGVTASRRANRLGNDQDGKDLFFSRVFSSMRTRFRSFLRRHTLMV